MQITRTSVLSGTTRTLEIPITPEQLQAWRFGGLIQIVAPDLTAPQREFIISGATDAEWARLKSDNDDDDDPSPLAVDGPEALIWWASDLERRAEASDRHDVLAQLVYQAEACRMLANVAPERWEVVHFLSERTALGTLEFRAALIVDGVQTYVTSGGQAIPSSKVPRRIVELNPAVDLTRALTPNSSTRRREAQETEARR